MDTKTEDSAEQNSPRTETSSSTQTTEHLSQSYSDSDSDESEEDFGSEGSVTSVSSTPELCNHTSVQDLHTLSENSNSEIFGKPRTPRENFQKQRSFTKPNSIAPNTLKSSNAQLALNESNNRRNSFLFRGSGSATSRDKRTSKGSKKSVERTMSLYPDLSASSPSSSPDLRPAKSKASRQSSTYYRFLSRSSSETVSPRDKNSIFEQGKTQKGKSLKSKGDKFDEEEEIQLRSSIDTSLSSSPSSSSSSLSSSSSSTSLHATISSSQLCFSPDGSGKSKSERERERVQEWHQELKMNQESTGDLVVIESGEQLSVWAGTKEKLIERLTYEKYPDPRYAEAFLLTFRAFISPLELLEGIIKRYHTPQPEDMDRTVFVREKQTPIRLRVFNVLKTWMEKHFPTDFQKDEKLLARLNDFLENDMKNDAPTKSMSTSLLTVLKKQTDLSLSRQDSELIKKVQNKVPVNEIKASSVPNFMMTRATFHQFSIQSLAQQICLLEFEMYKRIEPRECLHQGWNKKEKQSLAPNISAMISYFNYIAAWVSTEVVLVPEINKRATTLERFISLAEELKKLGNFNAFTEVIAGLESSAVFRLKNTWGLLPQEATQSYRRNKELLDSTENFAPLRGHLRAQELPALPYLGLFLTDLTFVQDANTDLYLDTGLINFKKLSLIADIILQLQHYQQTAYAFDKNDAIVDYLQNLDVLNEKDLMEHSLIIEPRKPKNVQRTQQQQSQ